LNTSDADQRQCLGTRFLIPTHFFNICAIILSLNLTVWGQAIQSATSEEKVISFNGSLNLSSEFYKASGIEARLPNNIQRMILRANVTLFGQVQLPFEIYLTSQQAQFQYPFNQFGVNPQISDWLTLHAGYFSSQYSDFTMGDVRIMGGGVDIRPGKFRLRVLYGRSRDAAASDSLKSFSGRYDQKVYAAQIGYGLETGNFVNLNLFHAIDDSTSIRRNNLTPYANENLVASINFGIAPIDELMINGEVAAGLFSNDITSKKFSDFKVKLPSFLFTLKNSSQVDGAAKLYVSLIPNRYWGLKMGVRWIGPGFVTLGYSQFTNDLVEYTVTPNVSLFERKLNLRSSLGFRYNNLRNNKLATTGRFTGAFSADYQITTAFGLNVQYNNNQVKATRNNDTLKTSNVFNSVSISPRYNFQEFGGSNNVMLNYSYQNSDDKIAYQAASVQNKTNSLSLMHSIFFPSTLNLVSFIMYNTIDIPNAKIDIYNFTETVGYNFFDNKLNTSLSIGYSQTKTTSTSNIVLLRMTAAYNLGEAGRITFNISNNKVNSGDNINPTYSELQGILQYEINF
jgi:hypothetical protein